jgi:hypothetical protein
VSEGRRDDADLDAFLTRASELQRRWREAAQDEPPASLDDQVRAAARRAAGAGPRSLRAPFATRWRVPLSIAAVVVVSATVTLMVADRSEHLPGTRSDDMQAAAPAAEPSVAQSEETADEARDLAPAAGSREAPPAAASPPTSTPDERRRRDLDARMAQEAQPPAQAAQREPHRSAAPVPPPSPQAEMAEKDATGDAPASPAAQMGDSASAPQPRAATDSAGKVLEAQKAAPPAAAPAEAEGFGTAEPPPPSVPAAGARAKRESSERLERPGSADTLSHAAEDAARNDPQRWIERIRALRRAGKSAEAEESLRDFRRQHPAYPLPADLQPLH